MEKKTGHFWPILCLLLLAPFVGEMLSGSSPPAEYFQVIGFTILTALYGGGAVLIRELTRRWGKGWITIFLLGMAYGIFEEGLVVRSFFDPVWMDLGILNVYGRTLGVNWIWSLALTLFHGAISICVPIMLVEMMFPAHKHESWLKKRGLIIFTILPLSTLLFAPHFSSYAGPGGILASLACMAALYYLAKSDDFINWLSGIGKPVKTGKPVTVLITFFLLIIAFIGGMFIIPSLGIPSWIDFIFLAALPWLALLLVHRKDPENWDERHTWSAVFGILLPWLLLAVASEAQNAIRPDDTSGMSMVALITFLALIILRVVIQRRRSKNA